MIKKSEGIIKRMYVQMVKYEISPIVPFDVSPYMIFDIGGKVACYSVRRYIKYCILVCRKGNWPGIIGHLTS